MALITGTDNADDFKNSGAKAGDIVNGLKGNDKLYGGDGIIFSFRAGDGNDTYFSPNDRHSADIFRFMDVPSTASFKVVGNQTPHITLYYTNQDSIHMTYFSWGYQPAKFEFSDGVKLTASEFMAKISNAIFTGSPENDNLLGLDSNDTLIGGKGNDILEGGSGSDTYVFSKGDGLDEIKEEPAHNIGKNTIKFTDVKSTDAFSFKLNTQGKVVVHYGDRDAITVNSTEDMKVNFSDGVNKTLSDLIKQKGIITSGSIESVPNYVNASQYDYLYVIDNQSDYIYIPQGRTNYSVLVTVPDYKLHGTIDKSKVTYLNDAKQLPYFIDALATHDLDREIGKGKTITYSFVSENTDNLFRFQAYTMQEKQAVRDALASWEIVSGITFREVADSVNVNTRFFRHEFIDEPPVVEGYAYYGGDVHIRNTYQINTTHGQYDPVLVHEIGHTLGLKHPGNYGDDEPPFLPSAEDNTFYTQMSYTTNWDHGNPFLYEVTGPRILDIAAIQYLYGVNKNKRTEDNIYKLADKYIWDGAGNDTLDVSTEQSGVTINLTPGSWIYSGTKKASLFSEGQAFIGFGTEIENVIGSKFNDHITGNDKANVLNGNAGADYMAGGLGNDKYYVDNVGDKVIEKANEGSDWVYSSINFDLRQAPNVEHARLIGNASLNLVGSADTNHLIGNNSNNNLCGLDGNDILDGLDGNDILLGGTGNDKLDGGAGNDKLDGGVGADRMLGGPGDDIYIVDNAGDRVIEKANEGTDWVYSSINFDLRQATHIEHGRLTGNANLNLAGSADTNHLIGNNANNNLYGLGGNDILDGLGGDDVLIGGTGNDKLDGGMGNDKLDGGANVDIMIGGLGNDTYIVDNMGDRVIEKANEGTDWVYSSITFDLRQATHVEHGRLIGNTHLNLAGSMGSNHLIGSNGNNNLYGLDGNDILDGLGGNDILIGGAGNDKLEGGAGKDTLIGGIGNDIFRFARVDDSTINLRDVINDFTRGQDKIDLSAIDANSSQAGNQAFSFIGGSNFSAAGQVRFAGGVVYGDVNGDKVADFAIELKNVTALQASDFIL